MIFFFGIEGDLVNKYTKEEKKFTDISICSIIFLFSPFKKNHFFIIKNNLTLKSRFILSKIATQMVKKYFGSINSKNLLFFITFLSELNNVI